MRMVEKFCGGGSVAVWGDGRALEHFPLKTKHILCERGSWRIRLG
jgi:hypothetical protein